MAVLSIVISLHKRTEQVSTALAARIFSLAAYFGSDTGCLKCDLSWFSSVSRARPLDHFRAPSNLYQSSLSLPDPDTDSILAYVTNTCLSVVTLEARGRSQSSPSELFGGQCCTVPCLSLSQPSTFVLPCDAL